MTALLERMLDKMPVYARRRVEPVLEVVQMMREVRNLGAVASMTPSLVRGVLLRQARREETTEIVSGHPAHFDWNYSSDFPEMRDLYRRAKQNQWDSDDVLDWSTSVDPLNPERPLLPEGFFSLDQDEIPVTMNALEKRKFVHSMAAWMLSQFLHGEQGALYAAAQVTESVTWMDGKLYGSTQVMDEGRHVEVFHRYIDTKLNKLYVINDNLFTIIDALISDSRWDMKFLGMQIMVEGLALGAFGTIYRLTEEPLLRELLRYVIQDEARHVHYGVLALKEHIAGLSDAERQEREDWVFEVALLMRNRFRAHEVYEEWFEGMMSRATWNRLVDQSSGLNEFRSVMFSRLIPNLRYIGLMPDRMLEHYQRAGLLQYAAGASAAELDEAMLLREMENQDTVIPGARVMGKAQVVGGDTNGDGGDGGNGHSHHDHDHGHDHEDELTRLM